MKAIIIDPFIETKKVKKKGCKEAFIYLTTKDPREQNKREDKQPFIYLPSTK